MARLEESSPRFRAGDPKFLSKQFPPPRWPATSSAESGRIEEGVRILLIYPPPLIPPTWGGETIRMPFIPALPGGAFWHVFVRY
jgi:hypothetical protein